MSGGDFPPSGAITQFETQTASGEDLMLQFQNGSREAFEELFARYRPPPGDAARGQIAVVASKIPPVVCLSSGKKTPRQPPKVTKTLHTEFTLTQPRKGAKLKEEALHDRFQTEVFELWRKEERND